MINFIYLVGFITAVLVVWFRTEAFVEYCNFLKIKIPQNRTDLTYPQFLYVTYKNEKTIRSFIIKLITCPMCLSLWLSIIFGIPTIDIFAVPLLYTVVLFTYFSLIRIIG